MFNLIPINTPINQIYADGDIISLVNFYDKNVFYIKGERIFAGVLNENFKTFILIHNSEWAIVLHENGNLIYIENLLENPILIPCTLNFDIFQDKIVSVNGNVLILKNNFLTLFHNEGKIDLRPGVIFIKPSDDLLLIQYEGYFEILLFLCIGKVSHPKDLLETNNYINDADKLIKILKKETGFINQIQNLNSMYYCLLTNNELTIYLRSLSDFKKSYPNENFMGIGKANDKLVILKNMSVFYFDTSQVIYSTQLFTPTYILTTSNYLILNGSFDKVLLLKNEKEEENKQIQYVSIKE